MTEANPVVDVHAHALFPPIEQRVAELDAAGLQAARELEIRRNGESSMAASGQMITSRWSLLTDLDTRIEAMDASGVDVQLISPSPSHYYPFLGFSEAEQVARELNRSVMDLVAQAPGRLRGLGVAPLQHPDLMAPMLVDAVTDCGLDGVEIGSFGAAVDGGQANTVELSDPRLESFWATAEDLNAVIFLHPFGCSLDERLDRFYLANTVAQPAENAVALSHLIFSGVLDRHPGLQVIAAHGGGYLPTAIGRSDRAWEMRPEARVCLQPPSHYLRKLWFDSLTHDARQLRALIETVGVDRVVLGSDYPFDMGSDDPVHAVTSALADPAECADVLRHNAYRILGERERTPVQRSM
ncbi:amidohydrolase family protein [Gordonia insulae]|uniref:Amidohydrolase-related domain-containing protein n=1 Tax=Gordonia insulae TaxID=2420509 RepID=A0A3G8JNL3_9ACTN|nr:amidohydrolase family protein [Gordonia insulae]AZG46225.1 hypothetical protein D7316_02826 [Gordonia insulae]